MDRRQFLGAGLASAGALATAVPALAAPSRRGRRARPFAATGSCEIAPQLEDRRLASHAVRVEAADNELALPAVIHTCNGDEDLYANRIASFSKTLPHDDVLGEVDPVAYDALLAALGSRRFDQLETVPQAGIQTLGNPLGAIAYTIEGPDSPALAVPAPPPTFASPEFAAELAEIYWMAILRDVNFFDYATDPLVLEARDDLANLPGYLGPRDPGTGEVRAEDLFRVDYPGARDGLMISQFLLLDFEYDGTEVSQLLATSPAGSGFLTVFGEWLAAQRGFPLGPPPNPFTPDDPLYLINARKLATLTASDRLISPFFKAFLIVQEMFGPDALDEANPYRASTRQGAFATFGMAHLIELLGKVHKSERATWYHKWYVHRYLRPDAAGGRVQHVMSGAADYPLHSDLFDISTVLPVIFETNRQINLTRLGLDEGSWFLPQMLNVGTPNHPSFPAGHSHTAGACVTLLKAWFVENLVIPNPKKPTPDGTALEDYIPGVDGPELTIGGELNKLAHNLSFGRNMLGVHFRADNMAGNALGEELAIRILREDKAILAEPFDGFSLTKFDGTTITV